jgi:hypothetical protein
MIASVSSTLASVSVLTAQSVNTSVGAVAEQEEKKKKSHIPSVEVSAAQSMGLSSRVGDFLVNNAGRSGDNASAAADGVGSAGSGDLASSGSQSAGLSAGPPTGDAGSDGATGQGGQGGQNADSNAQSAMAFIAGAEERSGGPAETTSTSAASILSLLSAQDGETDEQADGFSTAAAARRPPVGANTQYAMRQSAGNVFGVQFDEDGAYRAAASAA